MGATKVGVLFRRTRPPSSSVVKASAESHPAATMCAKRDKWQAVWSESDPESFAAQAAELEQLFRVMDEDLRWSDPLELPEMELGDWGAALAALPAATGLGLDVLGPRDLAVLLNLFPFLLKFISFFSFCSSTTTNLSFR